MPRARNPENKGLPPRWRWLNGAYRYSVPPGQEHRWDGRQTFTLGRTLAEAHCEWAKRIDLYANATTVDDLLGRYLCEVVPTKSAKSQREQPAQIARLRNKLGAILISEFSLPMAYRYQDLRGAKAPTAANRELEILSHAFTKAVRWGFTNVNPFRTGKFEKIPRPPRTRYLHDWEVDAALEATQRMRQKNIGKMLHAFLTLKLLTGRRRSELLRLRLADLQPDGVHFTLTKSAHKTGARTIIMPWSDALRAAIDEAKAARAVNDCPWLFCTRKGKPYLTADANTHAFDSLWQRFVDFVVATTAVTERFHDGDLRAKVATDAGSISRARELLGHTTEATTKKFYRRRPEIVKPTR